MTAHAVRPGARPPSRAGLAWLLAAQALVMLPFAWQLPVWIVVLALGALAWRATGLRIGWKGLPRWLLLGLAAAALAAVLWRYGPPVGRDPGVALLLLMMGLKSLETRSLREAMVGVYLAYFCAAAFFLFSQEIPTAGYMLAVATATTAALIALNEGPEPTRAGRRLRQAALLLAQSLPLMLALFLLFPRLPGPLWGSTAPSEQARTGLSDSISPGDISRLTRSAEVAFRVEFDDAAPAPAERYWRGPVFWLYDGRRWRLPGEAAPQDAPAPARLAEAVDYTVILQPHDRRWLFALDLPGNVPPGAYQSADYQLLARRPVHELLEYRVRSYRDYAVDLELPADRRRLGLQLPPQAAPRARALARRWREQSPDESAVVRLALDYFHRQPFVYTLSPPRLTGDPVDQFLFETRRGFCEHYASSFAVLMRAAGIPARVVTGYLGGELNPLGRYMVVRQADAHAWVEIWLAGRGWVRVDPTAAVAPERVEQGIGGALPEAAELPAVARGIAAGLWRLRLSQLWDSANYYWNGWVLAFGPERQRALWRRLGLTGLGWSGPVLALIGAPAAILAVYALLYARRARPGGDPAAALYARFCARLARIGLARRPHEGPVDFARRAGSARPDLRARIEDITARYVRLRYARAPASELRALAGRVRRFRPRRRPADKKKPAEAG